MKKIYLILFVIMVVFVCPLSKDTAVKSTQRVKYGYIVNYKGFYAGPTCKKVDQQLAEIEQGTRAVRRNESGGSDGKGGLSSSPNLDLSSLNIEQLVALETQERHNVEARINMLRKIDALLDAAVVQLNRYTQLVNEQSQPVTVSEPSTSVGPSAPGTAGEGPSGASPSQLGAAEAGPSELSTARP